MNIRHAILYGFTATFRQKRLILLLYLLNLAFGLLLILPLLPILDQSFGRSLSGLGIESRLEVGAIADMLRAHGAGLSLYHRFASALSLLYLVLGSVLAGGILHLLLAPARRAFLPDFMGGCGRFFFRYFRLFLFHLGFLVLVAGGNHLVNLGIQHLFEDSSHEILATISFWVKLLLLFMILLTGAAILDYSRILTAIHDRNHMLRALFTATRFLAANAGAVFALRFLALGAGAAILLVYWGAIRLVLPDSAWIPVLVLQQGVVLGKMILTVFLYASELNLYRGREMTEDIRLISRLSSQEALRAALD